MKNATSRVNLPASPRSFCIVLAAALGGATGFLGAQTPTLLEPGFKVEEFTGCTSHLHGTFVSTPIPDLVSCTPAAWGPERLVVGVHEEITWRAELLIANPPARATLFRTLGNLDDVRLNDIVPSPPGWPRGALLYVVDVDGPERDYFSGFRGLSQQGAIQDSYGRHSFDGWMGSVALDGSGAFNHDLLFEFDLGLYRRDQAGVVTQFLPWSTGGLQVGPGGPWGTDLYTRTIIVAPDGTTRSSPLPFLGPWASGPGFDGDMFAACGSSQVCRIKPDGSMTLFATGLRLALPTACDGALWFFNWPSGDCLSIRAVSVNVGAEILPPRLNLRSSGNMLSIRLRISEAATGAPLDPSLLSPAHISRILIPGADAVVLPTPSAEPGCDSSTQDGIWETLQDRRLEADGSLVISFRMPSDGDCSTMDGNRRDILPHLQEAADGASVSICFTSEHPESRGPFEGCGDVIVLDRGRGKDPGPLPRKPAPRMPW